MSRIIVLGGYGGFGGRISERLTAAGHDVIVAGRSLTKAQFFCAGRPGLIPCAIDRAAIARALAEYRPALLVDASGPFQAMDDGVVQACLAARTPYLDIADARAFVTGIRRFDAAARSAGVVLLSGASSVPALSGAVVRHLAAGLDSVEAVEMAISASNRAGAGASVMAAILAQVGPPMTRWTGTRWARAWGWQSLRRVDFALGDDRLARRWLAAVDIPDLALLPDRLPGRPAVMFRAGTELGFHNLLLWLLSWPIRWRLLPSLVSLQRLFRWGQRLIARLGSDRSAMRVCLSGRRDGARIERRWTLIASHGDGPHIPTLAIVPLVDRILTGQEAPGARDAGCALRLDDFEPFFAQLAVRHETVDRLLPPPLYAQLMGASFAALPLPLRQIHDGRRRHRATGQARVGGAERRLGQWVARLIGFPPAGDYPVTVDFKVDDRAERWMRQFGPHRFASRLSRQGELLIERFGPLRFGFDLVGDGAGLTMRFRRWWLGPLPLPPWLAPQIAASEGVRDGRFAFDVAIAVRGLGRIVHYRGWLEPDRMKAAMPSTSPGASGRVGSA